MHSRFLTMFGVLFVTLIGATGAFIWHKGIPVSAAGMASKMVCSGVFVAGRTVRDVTENDVMPASLVLRLAKIEVNERRRFAMASMPGSPDRYALWRKGNGCVLLAPGAMPPPAGVADGHRGWHPNRPELTPTLATQDGAGFSRIRVAQQNSQPENWPDGDDPLARSEWPGGINADRLDAAVDQIFAGPPPSSFSPTRNPADGPNTRAVLIVHKGQLLVERYGGGFDRITPQLGWSMAKTVLSVLVWNHFNERDIDLSTPVVDLIKRVPQPLWAGEWLRDKRAKITIEQLLTMRDGLAHEEGYSVWSDVPRMLFSERDIGHYAGTVPISEEPGSRWRYASAVSNLTSRVLREQFTTDQAYWQYPRQILFNPIGADSALIETDAQGTFVASSFMWARAQDWARLGQLLLNDGNWGGQQIFAPGWFAWASQRRADAAPGSDDGPYGAHVWQTHEHNQLNCPGERTLPSNGLAMMGHWGQTVGLFPDQQLVIVRLGWTIDKSQFNTCDFFDKVLSAFR